MEIYNKKNLFNYEIEKLCRIFLPFEKIIFIDECSDNEKYVELDCDESTGFCRAFLRLGDKTARFEATAKLTDSKELERTLAVQLYNCFVEITGYKAQWGILTGVRPAKLYASFEKSYGEDTANKIFQDKFLVSGEKISLCAQTRVTEEKIVNLSNKNSFSLYVAIPFCPTRCTYCSFVSKTGKVTDKLVETYLSKLLEEIEITSYYAKRNFLKLETIYIGGGTPTFLTAEQLEKLMRKIDECFDTNKILEYTVEAGRPDTIIREKLSVIKKFGATRISINPQTMSDQILENIGRRHTVAQTLEAFELAREVGFDNINMDLIAGLPGDTAENFKATVEKIIALDPESVTIHSLSLKRSSDMTGQGVCHTAAQGNDASLMVKTARELLTKNNILPYYMYRQSKTVGNLENVGYAKSGKEGYYNVFIMDETHTILACGASAVTKLRQYGGNYIERIFNHKYPYEYIDRFDELIKRKEKINLFYDKYGNLD